MSFNSPPPSVPSLNLSKQGLQATFGECYYIIFVFCLFYLHLLFVYFEMSILFSFCIVVSLLLDVGKSIESR